MTTEQMDWLDDERAGRHEQPVRSNLVYTDRVSAQGAMAALGDPLDPMPDKWVVHVLADDDPRLYERAGRIAEGRASTVDGIAGVTDSITDTTQFSENTLFKVRRALIRYGLSGERVTDAISEMQNEGILFRERVLSEFHCVICGSDDHDALGHPAEESYWVERKGQVDEMEEHTHHTREARDQCAAGDHKYAVLLDNAAKREKIAADEEAKAAQYVTMAEEPIENRLRRAYLNGFTDGFNHTNLGKWDR